MRAAGWERVFVLSGVFSCFRAVLQCVVLDDSAGGNWGGSRLGEEPCALPEELLVLPSYREIS